MDTNHNPLLNSSGLTGLIIAFAKHGIELEDKTRIFLLKHLIEVHEKYPIDFLSDNTIEAVNKIIKDIEG